MNRTQVLFDCDFHDSEGWSRRSASARREFFDFVGFSDISSLECAAGDSGPPD